jgi:hypothetical protein
MDRQLHSWPPATNQNSWLAALVNAMEEFSRPELRAVRCSRQELAAARARLTQPAALLSYASRHVSRFSLQN